MLDLKPKNRALRKEHGMADESAVCRGYEEDTGQPARSLERWESSWPGPGLAKQPASLILP